MSHAVRVVGALLLAGLAAITVAACGSSGSGNAQTLLRQTFSGSHRINSGVLDFSLTVDAHGSKALTQPVTLTFGGPFQSRGSGKLPASDFTISITAQGHTGSLSILSTGTEGFVTLSGTSYRLPTADFQQLESSFARITSSSSGSSGSPSELSRLGINPLGWLSSPSEVGTASVAGAQTEHVRAKVDVSKLLADLSTLLARAKSLGVSGSGSLPTSISPASRQRIAAEVQNPTLDVWSGTSDHTLRRLRVALSLPVSGQVSALLGGMSSAGIALTLQYGHLGQPQTITAPTKLAPYSQFQSRATTLVRAVESAVAAAALGGTGTTGATSGGSTGTTSTGTGTGTGGAAGTTSAYSRCITKAGSNLVKAQKCASLLGGS